MSRSVVRDVAWPLTLALIGVVLVYLATPKER